MTDVELAPYLAIPLSAGWTLDRAWPLLRDVAAENPGLDPEPFSKAVFVAVVAVDYPESWRSA